MLYSTRRFAAVVGIVLASAGCDNSNSDSQLTSSSPPAPPVAANALDAQAGSAVIESAPDFSPPENGELIADVYRDLRVLVDEQPGPSNANWSCLASIESNPWEDFDRLTTLTQSLPEGRSPRFEYPRADGERQPSILFGADGSLMLLPAAKRPRHPVVRWISSVDAQIIVQGRFSRAKGSHGDAVEGMVFVDGLPRFQLRLVDEQPLGQPFRIQAHVNAGSLVDFVISPSGEGSEAGLAAPTRLTASVYRVQSPGEPVVAASPLNERIRALVQATPKRPIPSQSETEVGQSRYQWFRKQFVEAHIHSHPVQAQHKAVLDRSVEFLDGWCKWLAKVEDAPSASLLLPTGLEVMRDWMDDPIVLGAVSTLCDAAGDTKSSGLIGQTLYRTGATLSFGRKRLDGPIGFVFHSQCAVRGTFNAHPSSQSYVLEEHSRAAFDALIQMFSGNVTPEQRFALIRLLDLASESTGLEMTKGYLPLKIAESANIDPWFRDLVLAREYRRLAWKARGSGYANTVTDERMALFRSQMERARLHALRAWQSESAIPQAAIELIDIVMAVGGSAGETERFWFDEAVRADPRCQPAYFHYSWSLRPRWGGSHEAMLEFARECLATARFDTSIPYRYHEIVGGIAEELGGWDTVLRIPGIQADYARLIDGYSNATADTAVQRRFRSQAAALAWLAGKREDARVILNELGGSADPAAFEMFNLDISEVKNSIQRRNTPAPRYFTGDPADATATTFLTNSKQLVTARHSGELGLWDCESRQFVRNVAAHQSPIVCLVPSSDGRRLLTTGTDGTAIVWNTENIEPIWRKTLSLPAQAGAWSPDGREIVIACADGDNSQAVIWNVDSGEMKSEELRSELKVGGVAFADSGRQWLLGPKDVATGDEEQLLFWNRQPGEIPRPVAAFQHLLTAWDLSPDGTRLAVGGLERYDIGTGVSPVAEIGTLDPTNGNLVMYMRWMPGRITELAFFRDSQRIAGICTNGAVFVWNSSTAKMEGCVRSRASGLKSLAISPDETHLAVVDEDGAVRIWPLDDAQLGWRIDSPLLEADLGIGIRNLLFVEDSQRLIVDSSFGGISEWDRTTGFQATEHVFLPVPSENLALFPDGQRFVQIGTKEDGTQFVEIVHTKSGASTSINAESDGVWTSVAVSRHGNMIALGESNGEVRLLNAESGEQIPWGRLVKHNAPVNQISFAKGDQAIVTASKDRQVKWWDLPSLSDTSPKCPPSRLTLTTMRPPTALAIAPDNSRLVASHGNSEVFDASTGRGLFALEGGRAVFSADGMRICTAGIGTDFTRAKVWDSQTGREIAALPSQPQALTSLVFTPDGTTILTGDVLGRVRAWNAITGAELLEVPRSP